MRILIIRPGAIGDTLLTFPVLQALRAKFAPCHITLVGNAAVLPLAQTWGIADAVADYEERSWGRLFLSNGWTKYENSWNALLRQIDMAICWLADTEGTVKKNLAAAGIKQVLVTSARPLPAQPAVHIVEYLAQTADLPWQTNNRSPLPHLPSPRIALPPSCIAIHPGSGGLQKCWPVARFAVVITALWQLHIPVLLLAGPADHERLATLRSLLLAPPKPALLTTLVDAPLLTVAHYLQQCQSYLGNDSGLTHLAALLGRPTIALFGPSDPVLWHPIGPNITVLYETTLEQIQVETVLAQLTS